MNGTSAAAHESQWAAWVRGGALILFGLAALAYPGWTLYSFAWLIAVYLLISGIVNLISGIISVGHRNWWIGVLIGLGELGVGVYLLNRPIARLASLVLVIGFFFLVRGALELAYAFSSGHESNSKALMGISGLLSIVLSFYLFRQPLAGGITFTWALGLYALVSGPIVIALGMGKGRY